MARKERGAENKNSPEGFRLRGHLSLLPLTPGKQGPRHTECFSALGSQLASSHAIREWMTVGLLHSRSEKVPAPRLARGQRPVSTILPHLGLHLKPLYTLLLVLV